MKKRFALILFALVVSLVSGCSGGGSPSDVAKDFYKAGNDGNYEKAESYLSISMEMAFEMGAFGGVGFTGGSGLEFENMMDGATKDGTIARIEVKGGEEYPGGYQAMVYLTLHYTDGSRAQDVLMLQKEDGNWKILQSTLLLTGGLLPP
ncbi:hypothetical protein ES705_39237 [subsurface metagenome]